jgi:hypothetical protein
MNHSRLRGIVSRLHLWNIDNMPTHTRRRHKATFPIIFQGFPINRGSLPLLPSPMQPRNSRTIKRAIQVRRHHFPLVLEFAV